MKPSSYSSFVQTDTKSKKPAQPKQKQRTTVYTAKTGTRSPKKQSPHQKRQKTSHGAKKKPDFMISGTSATRPRVQTTNPQFKQRQNFNLQEVQPGGQISPGDMHVTGKNPAMSPLQHRP